MASERLARFLSAKCLELSLASAVAGLLTGWLAGHVVPILKSYVPIAVFLMVLQPMFALNLRGLKGRLSEKLRFLLVVTLLYTLVYPLTAWLYAYLSLPLLPETLKGLVAGAVLVALAPVAMPAPVFTAIAGGDVEASVLSVTWTFILSLIVIPTYSYLILQTTINAPVGKIIQSLVMYIVTPLIVGQALRATAERIAGTPLDLPASRLNRILVIVSLTALYYVIFVSFAACEPLIAKHVFATILLAASLFAYFGGRFAISYLAGLLARLDRRTRIALVYAATGNGAIGLALSAPLGEAPLTGAAVAGPLVLVTMMAILARILAKTAESEKR